jgi:hypothetical protein
MTGTLEHLDPATLLIGDNVREPHLPSIPVYVLDANTDNTPVAAAERIAVQIVANDQRTALTAVRTRTFTRYPAPCSRTSCSVRSAIAVCS